ncbi:MAG: hypothetical protein Q8K65_01800 [Alphaproteobacteria bacterium]|nr:hypothetical protein [Alphaproteobacteria bacterium]
MALISCSVGDVLRWTEPVLAPPTQKRGKREQIGAQIVTAKVLTRAEVLELQVINIEILSAPEGFETNIKPADTIRRREASLIAGECSVQAA